MKTSWKITLLFLLIQQNVSFAQLSWARVWDHRYGGSAGDYLMSFCPALNHGYILAGKTASDSSGDKTTHIHGIGAFDYWIVKVDTGGHKVWEKDIGGDDDDHFVSVAPTSDGGYILGGGSDSPVSGDKTQPSRGGIDYWIVKVDMNGNIQWDKDFGGSDDDELRTVIQTRDGGYLVCGDSRSGVSGDKTQGHFGIGDFWVIKTDSLGIKQWDKVYGGSEYERFYTVKEIGNQGYILSGQSRSGISGNKSTISRGFMDYWIVRIDASGNILWDKDYGSTQDDYFQTMERGQDGKYLLAGWSVAGVSGDKTQPSKGGYDLWIIKVDTSGNISWDKDFGGSGNEDEFSSIRVSTDGGYLLGATSYSNASGDKSNNNLGVEQPWILKIDSVGTLQWEKTVYTMGHNENAFAMELGDNKCYLVVSGDNEVAGGDKTEDAWNHSGDYWIIKYCEGINTAIDENNPAAGEAEVFPNPFDNELVVKLNSSDFKNKNAELSLIDICGKEIFFEKFNQEIKLSTSHLPHGAYFVRVKTQNGTTVRKVLK